MHRHKDMDRCKGSLCGKRSVVAQYGSDDDNKINRRCLEDCEALVVHLNLIWGTWRMQRLEKAGEW